MELRIAKIIAGLPIALFSLDYLAIHGIRPGLALTMPAILWLAIGFKIISLEGLTGGRIKLALLAWVWPFWYTKEIRKPIEIDVFVNGVKVANANRGIFINALKSTLTDWNVHIRQFLVAIRAIIIGVLAAAIISPIAILSSVLVMAYFNKMYFLDLIVRYNDVNEPMREVLDALFAAKLLAISIAIKLLSNEYKTEIKNRIRVSCGVIDSGEITLERGNANS